MSDVNDWYGQDIKQISEWFQKVVEPFEQFPERIRYVPQHGTDVNVGVHASRWIWSSHEISLPTLVLLPSYRRLPG